MITRISYGKKGFSVKDLRATITKRYGVVNPFGKDLPKRNTSFHIYSGCGYWFILRKSELGNVITGYGKDNDFAQVFLETKKASDKVVKLKKKAILENLLIEFREKKNQLEKDIEKIETRLKKI